MPPTDIRAIKDFPSLIRYLRTDLGWPVDEEQADDLYFEYRAEELGLDEKAAAKVRAAKQLRPLVSGQPWGIFWIDFEPKKLPVTVMRRILNQLVAKKRGGKSQQATWNLDDLLFISAVGSEKSDGREITFAHFHQEEGDLPTLRVLGWDGADTVLKIDYVAKTLQEKLRWPPNPKDARAWRETWAEAFRHKPGHVIKTADALAARLAELARNIRAAAETIMAHESERGRLRKLHQAFQTALIHDLSEADFADTYAQTITYGLLTAAISRTDLSGGADGTALVAENITDMVPVTNPFLKEMLQTFLQAGGRKGGIDFDELGIQDVVELLRSDETDLPAILRDFNNRAEGEDPVIRFYEDFLAAYDKALKVQRGVFYTPKPVVSYIVRGVHELLISEFGMEDGLADTSTWAEVCARNASILTPKGVAPNSFFVTILDPATGTATFLVEVIDVIYKTMTAKWKKQGSNALQIQAAWNEYVPKYLLPRLYGYELMMAPYAIAHMKIGLKLFETGYHFASEQRANIYLTNALEEPSQLAEGSAANLFEALGHESQAVNDVKRRVHFTVVIGNPPYANFGMMNKNEWILKLLEDYKQNLNEKKINLDDDFIKFIRFAQWNIEKTAIGILAFITSNTFIDGVTHRCMREFLMETFNKIHILDLHGNSKKGEIAPDGSKDENVFDIQQGVSINLFVKNKKGGLKGLHHSDLWKLRAFKYHELSTRNFETTNWNVIEPQPPYFFFAPKDFSADGEYSKGWRVSDCFIEQNTGIQTKRDELFIDFDKTNLTSRFSDISRKSTNTAYLEKTYGLESSSGWDIKKLATLKFNPKNIVPVFYRPFDIRWLYYDIKALGRARDTTMKHMIRGENLGFITLRINGAGNDFVAIATNHVIEKGSLPRGNYSLFPLYLYSQEANGQPNLFAKVGFDNKSHNLSKKFIEELTDNLSLQFLEDGTGDLRKTFGPEDVFHYMYAVFHSPTYRSRYAEFLKIDFPRLPLTSNGTLFRELCALGKELVGLHLLEDERLENRGVESSKVKFVKGKVSHVEKGYPKYVKDLTGLTGNLVNRDSGADKGASPSSARGDLSGLGRVYVNEEHYFDGVREDVWNFHIGGYQVCAKWLKDRRERELSAEELVHYGKVVSALGETIRIMREVDAVIEVNGGWPVK